MPNRSLSVLCEKGRAGESDGREEMMLYVDGESCPCCDVSVSLQFRSEDLTARSVAGSANLLLFSFAI